MMFYVYLLRNEENKRYIGYSSNLKLRIIQHKQNKVKSTKGWATKSLLYYEAYCLESVARKRERFLKSGRGREYISKLMENLEIHQPTQ